MGRATEVSLEDSARALASGVDRELDASIGALQVLDASDTLRVGNLREFDRVARTVLLGQRRWTNLVLYDLTGQQLVSLLVPFGAPLQTTRAVELVGRVVGARTRAVSNFPQGPQPGKRLFRLRGL